MVLLRRLGQDMSRPVTSRADEYLYRPTQLLSWLVKSSGYDGIVYPSAMGSGSNVVLFMPDDAEILAPRYVRIQRVSYFSEPIGDYDDLYEESPYDFALANK